MWCTVILFSSERLRSFHPEPTPSQVATKATEKGNDADLRSSPPPPSCGVITEPEEQPAPRPDAPETSSMGRLGAEHDGDVEAAPFVAQAQGPNGKRHTAEGDADDGRESRGRRHVSGDDNATGDSCHGGTTDRRLGGSSTCGVVFGGEPQEPSTLAGVDQRHYEGGGGALPLPGSDSTTLLSHNTGGVGATVAQQGNGTKKMEDAMSRHRGTSGEGDGGSGEENFAAPAKKTHQDLARVAQPAVTATVTTTAAAKPTTTLTSHRAPEGFNTEMAAAGTTGETTTTLTPAAADQRGAARELEESGGSLEGDSAHSRWSLPETRGIGGIGAAGGLHEQRAVWIGGTEDDSVGTSEQAASSVESGGEGGDGGSPSRSRVESYDLQQDLVRERGLSKHTYSKRGMRI